MSPLLRDAFKMAPAVVAKETCDATAKVSTFHHQQCAVGQKSALVLFSPKGFLLSYALNCRKQLSFDVTYEV